MSRGATATATAAVGLTAAVGVTLAVLFSTIRTEEEIAGVIGFMVIVGWVPWVALMCEPMFE